MSRQDYIVRVRYQNTLPPPPCGPKLLKNEVDFDNLLSAGSLSTLIYQQPLDPVVDDKLGMPIDLVQVPHSFEGSMYDIPPQTELDAEDAALLEDASAGVPVPTAVAFLRRTEYSTNAMLREASSRKSLALDIESPSQQAKKVEESFEAASTPLDKLKHPKKQIKAIKSWKFIPDTKQIDLIAKSVRMVGSAAISQNKQMEVDTRQLKSSVFTTSKFETQEFASFFVPQSEDASASLADKQQNGNDEQQFQLVKFQDYEMVNIKSKGRFDEVVVSLDDKVAYYLPVQSRINLKRRRVGTFDLHEVQQANIDELSVVRTDVSAEDSIKRDQKRSKYDPVSYE